MKISELEIKNLFGLFDHKIPFKTKDRITIIHGPNGVGKTTVLKLLIAVFSTNFEVLLKIPYSSITVTFDNKAKLIVEKFKETENKPVPIVITYINTRGKKRHYSFPGRNLFYVGGRDFIDNRRIYFEAKNEYKIYDKKLGVFYPSLNQQYFEEDPRQIPKWLATILDSTSIYFIETQRLLSGKIDEEKNASIQPKNTFKFAVSDFSKEMAERMQETQRKSGALAASLDQTFPHRLLQGTLPKNATESKIREKYNQQASYRDRLMKAGLLAKEEILPLAEGKLNEGERKVLWYYLRDVDEKFETYNSLLQKIELFRSIINDDKFLFKTFYLDKEKGFVFLNKNQQIVPLSELSSGEQHELVLAYELIFKAKEKSLILIDEPEISLHVTWQHKFLDDLKKISELINLDFVVATHSPSIVHGNTNLMVSLAQEKY